MHAHRSLASYFDEDPRPYSTGGPASGNWYEQVEGGLRPGDLGVWKKSERYGRVIYLPPGKKEEDYDEQKAKKREKKREALIAGKKENKQRAKAVKSEHAAAVKIFMSHTAWDRDAFAALTLANEFITETANYAKTQKVGLGLIKAKGESKLEKTAKRAAYATFFGLKYDFNHEKASKMLTCAHAYLTKEPAYEAELQNLNWPKQEDGSTIHLSVFRAYVSTIKRTVLDAAAYKLHNVPAAAEFVRHSATAWEILAQMEKYKDRPYVPKWRPDKAAMDRYQANVLGVTAKLWVNKHPPGSILPYYLRKYAPKDGSYNPPARKARKIKSADEILSDPATAVALFKKHLATN